MFDVEGVSLDPGYAQRNMLVGPPDCVVIHCGSLSCDGSLRVYYGGAETVVGVATCVQNELLFYLSCG